MNQLILCAVLAVAFTGCSTEPKESSQPATVKKTPKAVKASAVTPSASAAKAKPARSKGQPIPTGALPQKTVPQNNAKPTTADGPPPLPSSRFALKPLRSRRYFKHKPVEPPPPDRGPDLLGNLGPKTKGDLKDLSEAAKAGNPIKRRGAPPIRKIDDHRFEIGRIMVDQKRRRLTVESNVNQVKGILEYVAVGPAGKTHESVLTYTGLASHVHLGLLLIGLEPRKKKGPKVDLTVEWVDPKTRKTKQAPMAHWLFDRTTQQAAKKQPWRFTGSSFWRGQYGGDSSHTLISTIPDGNAVIEADAEAGNPYRGENLGFEVNQITIPPKGTPVKLFISAKPATPK